MSTTPSPDTPVHTQLGGVSALWGPISLGVAGGVGSLVARQLSPVPAVWLTAAALAAVTSMRAGLAVARWRLHRRGQTLAPLGRWLPPLLVLHGAAGAFFAWVVRP